MPTWMVPTSLVDDDMARTVVGPVQPPRSLLWEPQSGDPVDEEEPEIVHLLAAHYRNLLALRRLTANQRRCISRLLDNCELRLKGDCVR